MLFGEVVVLPVLFLRNWDDNDGGFPINDDDDDDCCCC